MTYLQGSGFIKSVLKSDLMQYVEYCMNDLHYSRSCKSDVIGVAHILLVIVHCYTNGFG